MGQPTVGYPDWQQPVSRARFWQLKAFVSTLTQQTVFTTDTTVNIDSIGVRMFSHTGHGTLTFDWFNDQALTQFATGEIFSFREGDSADFSVVVKGAFLRVTATNVEPADWTITLSLYEAPHGTIPQRAPRDNILIRVLGGAVGAGATVTTDATRMWPGEVFWHVRSALATWEAALQHVDELGTVRTFDRILGGAAVTHHNLYLAAEHMRGSFTNTTGAAGSFDMFVIGKPGILGY